MFDPAWLGLAAIVGMPLAYVLSSRSPLLMLGLAAGSTIASAIGFAADAWPFGLGETLWIAAALRRWYALAHKRGQ